MDWLEFSTWVSTGSVHSWTSCHVAPSSNDRCSVTVPSKSPEIDTVILVMPRYESSDAKYDGGVNSSSIWAYTQTLGRPMYWARPRSFQTRMSVAGSNGLVVVVVVV